MKPCPQCGHSWGSGVRDQSRLSLAVASSVTSASVVSVKLSEGWRGDEHFQQCSYHLSKLFDKQRDKSIPGCNYVDCRFDQII